MKARLLLCVIAWLGCSVGGGAPLDGRKIARPPGGGIYLGTFMDWGFTHQITGDYGGSVMAPANQPAFYGQPFDRALATKSAVAPIVNPLVAGQEGITAEGQQAGQLLFDAAGNRNTVEQFGMATRYALGDIYVPGVFADIKNGGWDSKIDSLARTIQSYPYPLFINYWIEVNGIPVSQAPDFVAAMRRIHDRVEAIAPGQVTWVAPTVAGLVTPNAVHTDSGPLYQAFYPGDGYVDWHGFSFFCWTGAEGGASAQYVPARACLDEMRRQLAGLGGRPVMFEQFGLSRGSFSDQDRATWYRDFLAVVKSYPEVAAILFCQDDYVGWNTALRLDEPTVSVIRQEMAANPGYWHSNVQTGGAR